MGKKLFFLLIIFISVIAQDLNERLVFLESELAFLAGMLPKQDDEQEETKREILESIEKVKRIFNNTLNPFFIPYLDSQKPYEIFQNEPAMLDLVKLYQNPDLRNSGQNKLEEFDDTVFAELKKTWNAIVASKAIGEIKQSDLSRFYVIDAYVKWRNLNFAQQAAFTEEYTQYRKELDAIKIEELKNLGASLTLDALENLTVRLPRMIIREYPPFAEEYSSVVNDLYAQINNLSREIEKTADEFQKSMRQLGLLLVLWALVDDDSLIILDNLQRAGLGDIRNKLMNDLAIRAFSGSGEKIKSLVDRLLLNVGNLSSQEKKNQQLLLEQLGKKLSRGNLLEYVIDITKYDNYNQLLSLLQS